MTGGLLGSGKPTSRAGARLRIIQVANRWRIHHWQKWSREPTTLWSSRHIQQAVCLVRRHRLVEPELLVLAGYRAKARR